MSGTGAEGAVEIRVEGVHKRFGQQRVLEGVDLQVCRGGMVAIVGGSGCGKTVLLQVILRHMVPEQGRVLAADHESPGHPLRALAELDEAGMDRLRRHWAVVFQKNALFSGTVYENIGLWLREIKELEEDEIRRRALAALQSVGFDADDALLAKQRGELSGGMAKRVAVARALAMDPVVIFYDEPTTGLDPSLSHQVHDLIRTTHAEQLPGDVRRTTLIITHDKDLLYRLQPRVLMLDQGTVHFDGPYEEFRSSPSPIVQPYFSLMPELHAREARV